MFKRIFSAAAAAALLICLCPTAAAQAGDSRRQADALTVLGLLDERIDDLSQTVRRDQAAALLTALAGGHIRPDTDGWFSGFRDVPEGTAAAVNYAARRGWVRGRSTVSFGADAPLSANAWYAMVLRMLGYSESAGDFTVQDAAAFAWRLGLTGRQDGGTMTWEGLCTSAYELLGAAYKGGEETVMQRLTELGAVTPAALNALGLTAQHYDAAGVARTFRSAVFCLELYHSQAAIDEGKPSANASGFFLSADGVAVTNHHSIEKAVYGVARLDNGEEYPVESVLWYDAQIDAAVIRISLSRKDRSGRTSAFACLEAAQRREIRAGDTVYAISNPLGLGLAVSQGIVNAESRQADGYALPCILNSADISQGSSGGALLNVYGQVIGITSGVFTHGNNMFLAVPMDPVLSAQWTEPGQTLSQVAEAEKSTKT